MTDDEPRTITRTAAYARAEITPTVANQVLHHIGDGGYPAGSFFSRLLVAWDHADPINHARLTSLYPSYGAAVELLQQPEGRDALRRIAARKEPSA